MKPAARNSAAGAPANDASLDDLMRHAIALHQDRRLLDAIAVYRRILLRYPGNPHALTYFGCALLEIGRTAEAVEKLRAATAAGPELADAHAYLGNALQVSEDPEAAEAAYRRALELDPTKCRTHNNLGALLLGANRLDEAASCFRDGQALDPNHVQIHNNLCQVYTRLGDIDRAIEAGRRAVELAPRFFEGHNSLGAALALAERYDDAAAAFRRALSLKPGDFRAKANLALALVNAGDPRWALDATDACLEIDPGNTEILATRSVALSEAGDAASYRALVDTDRLLRKIWIDAPREFGSLAGFNDALAHHIRNHPTLAFAPPERATRGGMHSGDLLAAPKGPMAAFEQIICRSLDRYAEALPPGFAHPFLAKKPSRWRLSVWGLVLPAQGYQVPHIHHTGWVSGCYYVQVSEAVSEPDVGHKGWIEFGRPQSIYRTAADPDLRLVRPEEGMMVLFPSFYFHRTVPFEAATERICIAFDALAET